MLWVSGSSNFLTLSNMHINFVSTFAGYLSTKSDDIPGNAGLLDVILALNWVQKYIKHFGGDASCVTLFGQSSGACMLSGLAISPAVPANLFHRIIAQSGSAMSNWGIPLSPLENARDIASRAGLGSNLTLSELNRGLAQLDAFNLLKASSQHYVSTFPKCGVVN